MTPELLLGIDPGQTGGIALLMPNGEIVGAWPMPETESETVSILSEFAPRTAKAIIEYLHPMAMTSKVTMFKLGRSYGFLRGVLTVLQIPFDEVQPKEWQKAMQCFYPPKSKHPQRKAVNRQKAQQLFSRANVKIDDSISDALLLAEFLRRTVQ